MTGKTIVCPYCKKNNAPMGRSLPRGAHSDYCTIHECEHYLDDPKPSHLFPGEEEAVE